MVLAAAQALERLAKRLLVVAPAAKLRVQSAYLPAQAGQVAPTTNDNLGRVLMLTLDSAVPGRPQGAGRARLRDRDRVRGLRAFIPTVGCRCGR